MTEKLEIEELENLESTCLVILCRPGYYCMLVC